MVSHIQIGVTNPKIWLDELQKNQTSSIRNFTIKRPISSHHTFPESPHKAPQRVEIQNWKNPKPKKSDRPYTVVGPKKKTLKGFSEGDMAQRDSPRADEKTSSSDRVSQIFLGFPNPLVHAIATVP